MESTYQLLPTCSCGHQLILTPGSPCEICMGIVAEDAPQNEEWFGADYFDALENELSKGGIAA